VPFVELLKSSNEEGLCATRDSRTFTCTQGSNRVHHAEADVSAPAIFARAARSSGQAPSIVIAWISSHVSSGRLICAMGESGV
jgi:hypothetical protein